MNFTEALRDKKLERAMQEFNLELKKDAINFNQKVETAMAILMTGFACSAVASIYTEIASPLMIAFLCGSAITAGFYDPQNSKLTTQHMYNIFKSCGAISRNTNEESICFVLDRYSKDYKALIKNKSALNKSEFNLRKKELEYEYLKKIEAINNEERSEELFN